mmetsp:Transcript_11657/g.36614  ORF Transcript_11657/g.36614 Transcript_11657/m.36614 type:complete len:422 (+) Transcript_11657:24-1289(+)
MAISIPPQNLPYHPKLQGPQGQESRRHLLPHHGLVRSDARHTTLPAASLPSAPRPSRPSWSRGTSDVGPSSGDRQAQASHAPPAQPPAQAPRTAKAPALQVGQVPAQAGAPHAVTPPQHLETAELGPGPPGRRWEDGGARPGGDPALAGGARGATREAAAGKDAGGSAGARSAAGDAPRESSMLTPQNPAVPLSARAATAGLERQRVRGPPPRQIAWAPADPGAPVPRAPEPPALDPQSREAPQPGSGAADPQAHGLALAWAGGGRDDHAYLRRNIEHLILSKRRLEAQVISLEDRAQFLEQQNRQYKVLYEQAKSLAMCGDGGEMELTSLQQQLSAVQLIKDALNAENVELQDKLKVAQEAQRSAAKHTACVICMDNLANVVCLPCKHLSLCSFCCQQNEVGTCPICRSSIEDEMLIFIP